MAQEQVEISFVRGPCAGPQLASATVGGKATATMGDTFGVLKLCLSLVRRELSSRTPKVRRRATITQPYLPQALVVWYNISGPIGEAWLYRALP